MLDFPFRPLRSALDVGERVISKPLEEPEHELTVIVDAIHRTADSIEHHVEVIEGLATSVEPLKDSVNNLNATMIELVALLAPMASAGRGMQDVEHGARGNAIQVCSAPPVVNRIDPTKNVIASALAPTSCA